MIGGNVTKEEKSIPRWRIERIAQDLDGEVVYQIIVNNKGEVKNRIVIEYE
jgi:uncharacterized protein YhaN